MATNSRKSVTEAKPVAKKEKPQECVFSAAEIASSYRIFGTSKPMVVAALKVAGIEKATLTEAKKIIDKFLNKEVK